MREHVAFNEVWVRDLRFNHHELQPPHAQRGAYLDYHTGVKPLTVFHVKHHAMGTPKQAP